MKFPATHKYLELFKAANGGASDYRIAQLLDVTRATVSGWRRDVSGMSQEVGMKLADRLKLDAVEVVTELNADRANTRESREYYKELLKRIGASAALVIITLSVELPSLESLAISI